MKSISFNDYKLSDEILKALEKLGFESPTEVQAKVIPYAIDRKDIIVKSRTGSGKTAAFGIPICDAVNPEAKNPQALILTPTRELAVQVKEDISHIGRFRRIRATAVFGKQPMSIQKNELRQRVHVVVGTPGRTFDHIERGNLVLDDIKYLVIDEADKMLDMGFIDQIRDVIDALPKDRITMLFSATFPDEIDGICGEYMKKPIRIEIETSEHESKKIKQIAYQVEESKKFNLVKKLIYVNHPESCILFCNTREKVEDLFSKMKREGFRSEALHGGMEQTERLDVMKAFKQGKFSFLVATDVAARGIHVEDITLVVNYDLPMETESYVHRIGRTGRVEKEGLAVTLFTMYEDRFLASIEEFIDYKLEIGIEPNDNDVEKGRLIFEEKLSEPTKLKPIKDARLNKEVVRIRINSGRKDKMRPGDIVGAITAIDGVSADDIGIIDVQDTCSYVEIFGKNADKVLNKLAVTKIKGKIHTIRKVGFV